MKYEKDNQQTAPLLGSAVRQRGRGFPNFALQRHKWNGLISNGHSENRVR
jgi:hypothetical protein